MAQTKRDILDHLARAGSRPRQQFGQNFMTDANLVRTIADAAGIMPGDTVIEVGPGTGTLTEELLTRVGETGRVIAFEIDRDLAQLLREMHAGEPRFELVEGDALAGKHALSSRLVETVAGAGERGKLVANLPYNIASPLVIELLSAGLPVLAFTVQKEVADRLQAGPGDGKAYGPLSATVQSLAEVEVLRTIGPGAFWPPPKIDSALVRVRRRDLLAGRAAEFSSFVTQLFSQRRKTLRNALGRIVADAPATLAAAGLREEARPEEVDPERLRVLFDLSR